MLVSLQRPRQTVTTTGPSHTAIENICLSFRMRARNWMSGFPSNDSILTQSNSFDDITFLASQRGLTLPASSRSAKPSSRGSAMKVSLFLLLAVLLHWSTVKREKMSAQAQCLAKTTFTSNAHLRKALDATCFRNSLTQGHGRITNLHFQIRI